MKKSICFLLITILNFFLIGCYDFQEVNSVHFAASMGIDYNENNHNYTIYIYIINNLNLTGIELATSEGDKLAYVASSSDLSLTIALDKIYENSEIIIDLHHLKTLILTKNVCNNENLRNICEFLLNNYANYLNFSVLLTEKDIHEIYKVQNFTETSAYYTLLTNSSNYNKYDIPKAHEFINDVLSTYYNITYPLINISYDTFTKNEDKYITLYLRGLGAFNQNNDAVFFKPNEYVGGKYLNELENYRLSVIYNNQILAFDLHKFKLKKELKKDYLVLYYIIDASVLINNFMYKDENEYLNSKTILMHEITNSVNYLWEQSLSNDVDLFNLKHMIKVNRLDINYKDVNIRYKYSINIR